ncbi:MAG: hypothetical protein WAK20_19980 [Candidatus Acidiferrum sp.]
MATSSVIPASQPATTHVITREEGMRSLGLTVEGRPLAESAPAAETEIPAVTKPDPAPGDSESAAASEAAPIQEPKPVRGNAQSRIRELNAQNRILQAQLEEARRGRTAEPSPAEAKEPKPEPVKAAQPPVEPDSQDPQYKTWGEYEAAFKKYVKELVAFENKQAWKAAEEQRVEAEQTRGLQQQLEDGRKRYPEMDKVIKPLTEMLSDPKKAGIDPSVAGMIGNSPVLPDLLYVLGADKAQLDDFLETAKSDPVKAIRLIVLTEQMVIEELRKGKGKTGDAETTEKTPVTRIPPVLPKPASEVNTRGASPPDELAALRAKRASGQVSPVDFSRLRVLENAARLKGVAK